MLKFHQPYKPESSTAELNFANFSIDFQGLTQLPRHKDLMPLKILQGCCIIRCDTAEAPEGQPGHPKVSQKAPDIYGWANECPLVILAVWWLEESSWDTVWAGIIYITLFYRLSIPTLISSQFLMGGGSRTSPALSDTNIVHAASLIHRKLSPFLMQTSSSFTSTCAFPSLLSVQRHLHHSVC